MSNIRSELTRKLGKDPGVWIHQQKLATNLPLVALAAQLGITYAQARSWRREATGEPLRKCRHHMIAPDGKSISAWLRDNGITSISPEMVISRLHKGWPWHDAVYKSKGVRRMVRRAPASIAALSVVTRS